jgi:hypothetical protein
MADDSPAHCSGSGTDCPASGRAAGDLSRSPLTRLGAGVFGHFGTLRDILFCACFTDLLIVGIGIEDRLRRGAGREQNAVQRQNQRLKHHPLPFSILDCPNIALAITCRH